VQSFVVMLSTPSMSGSGVVAKSLFNFWTSVSAIRTGKTIRFLAEGIVWHCEAASIFPAHPARGGRQSFCLSPF
jgi:hypothetical protein